MKLLYRLGYYLAGFSFGLIFLTFIFNGKKTSCNYGPSARVKDNLLQKDIVFSKEIKMRFPELTDSLIRVYINTGELNFSKSKTQLDSCRVYHIELNKEQAYLQVANCKREIEVLKLLQP